METVELLFIKLGAAIGIGGLGYAFVLWLIRIMQNRRRGK